MIATLESLAMGVPALAVFASLMAAIPLIVFGLSTTLQVLRIDLDDESYVRIAKVVFGLTTACGLAAALLYVRAPTTSHIPLGHWFALSHGHMHYGFDVGILIDHVSLTYLLLTSVLSGIVGAFSLRYLRRETGSKRFFSLLMLFAGALSILVLADTLDLAFVGWELVGISSALLIAFYRERTGPAAHGMVAFVVYRICDAALLIALVLLHHLHGSGAFPGTPDGVHSTESLLLAALILVGSLGKSAQWPFTGWLPRAMEGPTPSSAIFYGALSIHAGVYLLLRTAPLWEEHQAVRIAMVLIGGVSAVLSTVSARVQPDIKSSLAFASASQVSLIFIELGFGWYDLALLHVTGHAFMRTTQLLRAPSVLEDHFRIESHLGVTRRQTGRGYEKLLPQVLQNAMFRFGFERGYGDPLAARGLIVLRKIMEKLDRSDRALASLLDPSSAGCDLDLPELAQDTSEGPRS